MGFIPNFNCIAPLYRWLEHLTLGCTLERCRTHFLPQLTSCRRALVLGDGDGRFLAALLAANQAVWADAVDTSANMLHLLRRRCAFAKGRFNTHHCNALDHAPAGYPDLIVTHFFLDCLPQHEVDALVAHIAAVVSPGAIWLLSEFRIPYGLMRLPAKVFIRLLYLAFHLLTGLRVTRLPNHQQPLKHAGFIQVDAHRSLAGMLTTEIWCHKGQSSTL